MRSLNSIKAFFLDMDGTFYLGDHLLPGALEFLKMLTQRQIPFSFLTNNSSRNSEEYKRKLISLGVNSNDARVFTSGDATARYLTERTNYKQIYLAGTPSLEEVFTAQGFILSETHPDAVVLGFDMTLTYAKLRILCDHLRDGVPFIATHPDINCPTPSGFIPDIGSMIAMIKTSTGREPDLIIGKPNRLIVDMLAESMSVKVDDSAMVGDRLYTDIALGKTSEVTTILVLSGETKPEDLLASSFEPDHIFRDLLELTEAFQKA
jgi:HAD superfamily hydrolase (TIGR01457 family)